MKIGKLRPGKHYALRADPASPTALEKVRLMKILGLSEVVIARWRGDTPVIIHPSALVSEWRDRRSVVADERSAAELRAAAVSDPTDKLERQAAWIVFSALENPLIFPHDDTKLSGTDVSVLCALAGIRPAPSAIHPAAYRDRFGWVHVPAPGIVGLARTSAARHRWDVLEHVRAAEAKLLARIREGARFSDEDELISLGVVREWSSPPRQKQDLGRENARLRTLIAAAAEELERAGRANSADSLRAVLD